MDTEREIPTEMEEMSWVGCIIFVGQTDIIVVLRKFRAESRQNGWVSDLPLRTLRVILNDLSRHTTPGDSTTVTFN